MKTWKQLHIATIFCVFLILAGLILASFSRDAELILLPLAGVFAVIGGFIGLIVIDSKRKARAAEKQARMPLKTDMVQIVSRRVAHTYRMGSRGGSVSSTDAWCLTFQTSSNGKIELVVPWDVWENNPDGTRGQLRWKGSQFIRFTKM